jgi:aspartate/methionine/tyrosine aminotransferase
MFHVSASTNVLPGSSALAGIVVAPMMSSRAGNRNMLSFTPQFPNYRTILTAPQQKSNGRESRVRIRFS